MRSLATLVATLALCTALAAGDDTMEPREVEWKDEGAAVFDEEWRMPSMRVPENQGEQVDLLKAMKSLAKRRFEFQAGETPLPWTRSFGDLVRCMHEGDDDAARRKLLGKIRTERKSVWDAIGPYLSELVLVEKLQSDEWDPGEKEPDNGLLLVEPFDRTASGLPPWTEQSGTTDIYQAAALIRADLRAIKDAEADFTKYLADAGAHYEYIHAVRDSYIRGTGPDGGVRAALRISFSDDLPFPYTTLDCDVRMLSSLDSDGHLVTDFYSRSDDVHWLAGQSVSIPVYDSDGAWVAQLQVLAYGIDITNVPEGDGSRRAIVRGNLGNLKRRAERRYAEIEQFPRIVQGSVPYFRVRGVGPAPEDEDD